MSRPTSVTANYIALRVLPTFPTPSLRRKRGFLRSVLNAMEFPRSKTRNITIPDLPSASRVDPNDHASLFTFAPNPPRRPICTPLQSPVRSSSSTDGVTTSTIVHPEFETPHSYNYSFESVTSSGTYFTYDNDSLWSDAASTIDEELYDDEQDECGSYSDHADAGSEYTPCGYGNESLESIYLSDDEEYLETFEDLRTLRAPRALKPFWQGFLPVDCSGELRRWVLEKPKLDSEGFLFC